MTNNQKNYLIILSTKGGGDRPPVVALAIGLRDQGHHVSVLCDVETAKFISSTGLHTITFPQELDKRGQISGWFMRLNENGGNLDQSWKNPMIEWADPLMPVSIKTISSIKPDLIISSLFGIGLAAQLSDHSGTPWCFVNPSFYFGEHATSSWDDDWYGPYIPRLAKECFLPLIRQANIVLHATDPEFDFQPTQLSDNHHYVGFLLWDPEMTNSDFINDPGNPWALITLSSQKQEDEVLFARSALNALSGRPVRSILTQPDDDIRDELENIPDNALITGFVSHTPVLNQSALVINHAGHGIVSKALYYGVPMVLLPWDRDQPGVAARAEKLGVARVVQRANATPEEVAQAVDEVLDDPKYLEAATLHSDRLQALDAVALACKKLEELSL